MLIRRLLQLALLLFVVMLGVMAYKGVRQIERRLPLNEQQLASRLGEDWVDFEAEDGAFRVSLPAEPIRVVEEILLEGGDQTLIYDVYTSEHFSGATVSVTLIHFPEDLDLSFPDTYLTQVANDMLSSLGARDFHSLDLGEEDDGRSYIVFSVRDDELYLQSRAWITNKTLFLLIYADYPEQFDESIYYRLVDSFQER